MHAPLEASRNCPSVQVMPVLEVGGVGTQPVRSFVSGVNPVLQVVQTPVVVAQLEHPCEHTAMQKY